MKRTLLFWLGWTVSILLLSFTLRNLDWYKVTGAIMSVSPFFVMVMICIYLFGFLIRAWRWQVLLPNISFRNSLYSVVLGYAANNILPSRLGELVRAQAIGKKSQISRSLAVASIFVERIFDGLILTACLYLGIVGTNLPQWANSVGMLGVGIFGSVFVIISLLALTQNFWIYKLSLVKSSKLRNFLLNFNEGLTLVWRDPSMPLKILLLSWGVWLVEGCMFYISIRSFDLNIAPNAALFMMALVNLGILIPSSPGYLGAFQYFGVLALGAWHILPTQALACTILIHATQYVPITIWGFLLLPYFGFTSLGKLKEDVS